MVTFKDLKKAALPAMTCSFVTASISKPHCSSFRHFTSLFVVLALVSGPLVLVWFPGLLSVLFVPEHSMASMNLENTSLRERIEQTAGDLPPEMVGNRQLKQLCRIRIRVVNSNV